jgi:hypothetical protein
MRIDERKMIEVVNRLCTHTAVAELGTNAAAAVARLWPTMRDIYHYVEPLMLRKTFAVTILVDDSRDVPAAVGIDCVTHTSLESAAHDVRDGGWLMEIASETTIRLWPIKDVDLSALASFAIVYMFANRMETLRAGNRECHIPNLTPQVSASAFARPTFLSLETALEHYRQRVARTCQCRHLEDAIFDPPRRLYWKAKPEIDMRRSLFKYLYDVLSADAEIRPEQVVDESHPVDIKVTWNFVNRLALIEIKWVGDSRNPNGTPATSYRDARARSGAQQLANYLDANRQLVPTFHTKGYLVVFDARRKALGEGVLTINAQQGRHYERREIAYDPQFHRDRSDFAKPVRLFVEPVL